MSEPSPAGPFARRHIGPSDADLAAMLEAVGAASMDELIDRAVPEEIRTHRRPDVPGPLTEVEAIAELRKRAAH